MTFDCVVVGAGATGMASALLLARHGRKVLLLEKEPVIAPLLRRFRRDGVWFDVGFHYTGGFGLGGTLPCLLSNLGVTALAPTPLAADGFDLFLHRGRELAIPAGWRGARAAFTAAFPGSASAVAAYFDLAERLLAATPLLSFSAGERGGLAEPGGRVSLAAFLRENGAEEDLVELLGAYGFVLSGSKGEEIPLAFHALLLGGYFQGAATFPEGGDSLVKGFESALSAAGVEVRPGAKVAGFEVDGEHALVAVHLDGGDTLPCREAVCTLHPQLLPGLLPPASLRPAFRSRLRDYPNSPGMFAVYLDVDPPSERLALRNLYILSDGEFLAVMGGDPGAVPRKGLTLLRTVEVPEEVRRAYAAGSAAPAYLAYKEAEAARTLSIAERTLPELRGRYRVLDAATPLTFERYTGTVGGSAYGLVKTVEQIPLSARTSVKGLWLGGQSVHYPGLMGTVLSAYSVCGQMLPETDLWEEAKRAWRSDASS